MTMGYVLNLGGNMGRGRIHEGMCWDTGEELEGAGAQRDVGQIWRKSGLVGSVTQETACLVKAFQFPSLTADSRGLCCSCGQQRLQHPR